MNPFLYGNKDGLSLVRRQTSLNTQPRKTNSDLEEARDGASPVPKSLSGVFGNSPDATDGGARQGLATNSGLEMSRQSYGFKHREALASSSVVRKTEKKVWAKKKLADSKAKKGKKRS